MYFQNRLDAGRQLAGRLEHYANRPDVLILALPRGGVPVGYEIARALGAPLDVFVVRKLGVPGHEELAMGAVASGGTRVLKADVVEQLDIAPAAIERVTMHELRELVRRERAYRDRRPPPDVGGRTVILVDDGLATGSTMRAAAAALHRQHAAKLVVAVPLATPQICDEFRTVVDEIVCLITPDPFYAVGIWYRDFSQTTDEQVRDLLDAAASVRSPDAA
jgi:putative phosphoribosyl transferase